MPTSGEYRHRARRRRVAAALLLAPAAGYGVQAARQRLRAKERADGASADATVAGAATAAEVAGDPPVTDGAGPIEPAAAVSAAPVVPEVGRGSGTS